MKTSQRLLRAGGALAAAAALSSGLAMPAQAMTGVSAQTVHPDSYWSGTARSAGECKVWLNRSGDKFQMLGESWGHYCSISFVRYHNGVQDLKDPRNFGTGTIESDWYWDGPGYEVYISVYDNDTRQGNSGGPFTL
ncbi:hypothetical protein ACFV2H_49235 [Streptomyces sp. NPDC059629]|uniref:hypothetical protein n=1 Tax=Streptomyces sp. NPDC059629 TaxID=3346889 RepID=UPI0036C1B2BA